MVKKFPNLLLGLALVAVLSAGSLQGRRVDHLRDCDRFYRWIISACTQVRIFGIPGNTLQSADGGDAADVVLFQQLIELSDGYLPDVPVAESDYDDDGQPYPKIVRYTVAPTGANLEMSEQETGEIESEEQVRRDWILWKMAGSNEFANLRSDFIFALRDGKLTSSGTQFNLSGLYEERGTTISLANMFLGFRKMAANLVWLEVDKKWHEGKMYQMVPLMRTCVTLDPSFVDAFLVGAWHLSYNIPAKLQPTPYELRTYHPEYADWLGEQESFYYSGIEFLKDGIFKNPRNYKLYFDMGFGIYEQKLHNIPKAVDYLSEAIRLDHDRWVRRQLYRLLGEDGRFDESKAGWESYAEWQPNNEVAPRFIRLMEGAIKERSADWASIRARAAENRAKLARQQGDEATARDWEARAEEARTAEAKGYDEARKFWQEIVDASEEKETYALSRVLLLDGREKMEQGRYVEAIVDFDRARWSNSDFWDEGTRLMLEAKLESNEPLALTEQRQLDREAVSLEYTRHLPKSIGGAHYEFRDGTWFQLVREGAGQSAEAAAGSEGGGREARENAEIVPRDSAEMYEILYNHPEIGKAVEKLEGDIVLQAGGQWYRIDSPEPAPASKLYTPPTAA